MPKRRHGIEKFPEIEEKIRSGEYTVREPEDKKKHTCEITWTQMRFIYDESDRIMKDFFFV